MIKKNRKDNHKLDESKFYLEELRKFFWCQLTILKGLWNAKLKGRAEEIKIVLGSSCCTGWAIYELGGDYERYYTEMMMLARSFIEKIINFCYVMVCDETEYKKFLLHPLYRAYHQMEKSKYAGDVKLGIKFLGRHLIKNNLKVSEALSLFSESDPRLNWSDKNLDQKVAVIKEKTNINIGIFLMNTLTIYSNASEALHGSLYGCSFHTGAYDPTINTSEGKEIEINLIKNTALLYVQLGFMIHEVVKYVVMDIMKDTKLLDLVKGSQENEKKAVSIMKALFGFASIAKTK